MSSKMNSKKKGKKEINKEKKKDERKRENKIQIHHKPRPNRNYDFYQSASLMLVRLCQTQGYSIDHYKEEERAPLYRKVLDDIKIKDPMTSKVYQQMMSDMIKTVYGTMMPEIKFNTFATNLVNAGIDVVSTTGSLVNIIYAISAGLFAGIGLWMAIFDEYRPPGPFSFRYFPRIFPASGYPTTNAPAANGIAWAIGLIDYVDMTTTIGSIPLALMADTHKQFPLNPPGLEDPSKGTTTWNGEVLGTPDLTWLGTSAISTNFVCFKMIQAENVYGTGNIYWGYLHCRMTFQFRQQNPT